MIKSCHIKFFWNLQKCIRSSFQKNQFSNASANVKDIFALESFLSPQEFKDTFLNSINEFIEQLKPYRKTVERTYKVFNNVTQQFKHVSSEFNNAERPYIEACIAENEFIVENGVFIHNGFKAEKLNSSQKKVIQTLMYTNCPIGIR